MRVFINPAGVGWAHVSAALLVRVEGAASSPRLATKALFADQNPGRGKGRGIFGQVIESHAVGDRITVKAYRAPFGSE